MATQGEGGPYFEARWRRRTGDAVSWESEKYLLFSGARDRLKEEVKAGADIGYIEHMPTGEAVYSLSAF